MRASPVFHRGMTVGLLACLMTFNSCLCASLTTEGCSNAPTIPLEAAGGDVNATTATSDSPESIGRKRTHRMRSEWYNTSHHLPIDMTSEERHYFDVDCGGGGYAHSYGGRPRLRQEYRTLTDKQRHRLHEAFNLMRNTTVPGDGNRTEYEVFIAFHRFSIAPGAHFGPAFALWHREYCLRFERGLQKHDPSIMLPYFDSSLDSFLPEPKDSTVWTSDYLGNNDDLVTSGFASNWTIYPDNCAPVYDTLVRDVLPFSGYLLFDDYKLNRTVYNATSYTDLVTPYPLCEFEDNHGNVHVFVGGQMGSITCSPNDPFFFLHHSYIDCIYEIFRTQSQKTPRETEYPDDDLVPAHHAANDTMLPFEEYVNTRGLSDDYTRLYYGCASSPRRCSVDADCQSAILWCHLKDGRCKAKVREGGYCAHLPDAACYVPTCNGSPKNVDGYCQCSNGAYSMSKS